MGKTDNDGTWTIVATIILVIIVVAITWYTISARKQMELKDQQYMERHNLITADIQENYALINFDSTAEHPSGGSYRIYQPYTYAPKVVEVDSYDEFMEIAYTQNISKVYITGIDYGSTFHFFSENMEFVWLFTYTKQ